jgi:hypothetical protein
MKMESKFRGFKVDIRSNDNILTIYDKYERIITQLYMKNSEGVKILWDESIKSKTLAKVLINEEVHTLIYNKESKSWLHMSGSALGSSYDPIISHVCCQGLRNRDIVVVIPKWDIGGMIGYGAFQIIDNGVQIMDGSLNLPASKWWEAIHSDRVGKGEYGIKFSVVGNDGCSLIEYELAIINDKNIMRSGKVKQRVGSSKVNDLFARTIGLKNWVVGKEKVSR